MEEGGFQFQPGISERFTASLKSPDIDWDNLKQVPLYYDASSSPEVAIHASSSSSFFASSSIFLSDATTTTAATNTLWSQPNTFSSQPGTGVAHTMPSKGAMVGLDSDLLEQLLPGHSPWPELATNESISSSSFASPSTFPSDATTNREAPAGTNTCLIQPSIPVPRTTLSQGAADDLDLPEQLLSDGNPWLEVAPSTSRSLNFFATPSIFPSNAKSITASVRERLAQALAYIQEMQRDNHVLVQAWVPVKNGEGQLVLTTAGQPCRVNKSSDWERLMWFRDIAEQYDVVLEGSVAGLTGRVFLGKLPEWSPDVRCFTSYKYPTAHAQSFNLHATMGLPVFQKGNNSCLGVIELVTKHKLNFSSDLDNICSALQAVDLTTTRFSSIPRTKFNGASYIDALPEIVQVLRAACIIHKLPLAQTWATCAHQGKRCRHHSDENCRYCISTIDATCYVNDPRMQIFHEACSEHHLLPGQGVVGKAFTTNQACFLPDIGSSSKQEYPLSNHAKIFRLKGAVAIRLRCTHTGTADFVLEFYLPTDCGVVQEQKEMLDFLWGTVRSLSKTLRMVTDKEMEDDVMWGMNEISSVDLQKKKARTRKPMARRSHVWKSFTVVKVGDTAKAKCNHCDLELCCDSKTHGTSSLRSHLKRCKLNPDNRITGAL